MEEYENAGFAFKCARKAILQTIIMQFSTEFPQTQIKKWPFFYFLRVFKFLQRRVDGTKSNKYYLALASPLLLASHTIHAPPMPNAEHCKVPTSFSGLSLKGVRGGNLFPPLPPSREKPWERGCVRYEIYPFRFPNLTQFMQTKQCFSGNLKFNFSQIILSYTGSLQL